MKSDYNGGILYTERENHGKMAEHGNVTVFVACDKVIQEANTNKKSLIGMFKNFNFAQLPGRLPQWFLYAQISDLEEGERVLTINIVHDSTTGVVFSDRIGVPKDHPKNIDLCLDAGSSQFDKEGEYNVTLNIDGTQHASFILTVTLRQKQ